MTRASRRLATAVASLTIVIAVAEPLGAYTTPWMHPTVTHFGDGWGILDPATLIDPDAWDRAPVMTGGWGGLRQRLDDAGIAFAGAYVMETAGNPTGGQVHKVRYTHDLGLGVYFDLGKLLGLNGTFFFASASERAGNNLSDDIPNFFQVQQEFGNPTVRLDNLAIEQQLLDGRLDLVAGRIKATDDFAYSWVSCYSQNLGLCDFRLGTPYNGSIPSHPYSAWGLRAYDEVTPELYTMTGAYNTFADFRSARFHGVDFSIRHDSGAAIFQEFGYSPDALRDRGTPGTFKLGGFYDSEPRREFETGQIRGTWMLYGLAQQRLYGAEAGTRRGLTGLLGFSYAPPAMNTLEYFVNAGLVYEGLLPQRVQDVLGLFFIWGGFSSDLRDAQRESGQQPMTDETILELNYTYNHTSWLHIQPGIQGVIRPNGTGQTSDALVLSLQVTVDL